MLLKLKLNAFRNIAIMIIFFNFLFAIFWWIYTKGNLIYYWDAGFPLNPFYAITRFSNVWNGDGFPGGPEFGFNAYLPIAVLEIPFYILGIPIGIIQWIIVQFFSNLSLIGFYRILRALGKNIVLYKAVLLSLINLYYLINFYTLNNWILGELPPTIIPYTLTPLLLSLFIDIVFSESREKILLYMFIVSVIGLSGVFFNNQYFTFYFTILIFVSSLIIYKAYRKSIFKIIKRLILYFLALMLSSSWLLLYFLLSSLGAFNFAFELFSGQPSIEAGVLYSYSTNTLLILLSNFILNLPSSIIDKPILYVLSFLYPLLISIPILLINKIKNKQLKDLLLSLTFVLLIAFAFQSGLINLLPLLKLTFVLHNFILKFIIIGESYMVTTIGIDYLDFILSALIFVFILSVPAKKVFNYLKIIATLFLIALFITNTIVASSHIYTSYSNGLESNVTITNIFKIPAWFKEAMGIISNSGYNNLLVLPIQNFLYSATYYKGTSFAANNDPSIYYFNGEIINVQLANGMTSTILNIPSNNVTNFTNFLKVLGVKYVKLNTAAYPGPGLPARPWTNLPGAYPWNFTEFEKFLNNTQGLKLVGIYGPYWIYEVNGNVPLVYASNGVPGNWSACQIFWIYSTGKIKALSTSLINNVTAPLINNVTQNNVLVKYKIINNDEVKISVNATRPFYLIYDQGFSNLWVLKINGRVNTHHFEANEYANAWLMPKGRYTVIIINKLHDLQNDLYYLSLSTPLTLFIIYVILKLKMFNKFKLSLTK